MNADTVQLERPPSLGGSVQLSLHRFSNLSGSLPFCLRKPIIALFSVLPQWQHKTGKPRADNTQPHILQFATHHLFTSQLLFRSYGRGAE